MARNPASIRPAYLISSQDKVYTISFDLTGKNFIAVGTDKNVKIFSLKTRRAVREYQLTSIAISTHLLDDTIYVYVKGGKLFKAHGLSEKTCIYETEFDGFCKAFYDVDAKNILVPNGVNDFNGIDTLNLDGERKFRCYLEKEGLPFCQEIKHNQLYIGFESGKVAIFEANIQTFTPKFLYQIARPGIPITSFAMGESGHILAVSAEEMIFRLSEQNLTKFDEQEITNKGINAVIGQVFLFFFEYWLLNFEQGSFKKIGTLHDFACHPCAGAMLIFSVSFQF